MTASNTNTYDCGSSVLASVRLVVFLAGSIASIPFHWLYNKRQSDHPFRITQLHHRFLLKLLGIRLRIHGMMTTNRPTLFVCNHTSYLDIPVLGALLPAAFVAKSEVSKWPFFGLMAKLQQSVFVERQVMRTGDHANVMRSRLAKGHNLILFPEGTSSDGLSVLPFKSSFFAIAEDAGHDIALTVQPISAVCTAMEGLPVTRALRPFYSWYGDMTLMGHLWNAFKIGSMTVDVIFHPAVHPQDFPNRKALAAACQQQVAQGVESCITGRLLDAPPEKKLLLAPEQAVVQMRRA